MKLTNLSLLAGSALALLAAFPAQASTDDFLVTVTTQAALVVECTENLRFGTVSVVSGNPEAEIQVLQTGSSSTQPDTVILADGTAGWAVCSVSGAGAAQQFALSAETGDVGANDFAFIENLELVGPGGNILFADIATDRRSVGASSEVVIGGSLIIPANHTQFGDYQATVTLTVTD